MNNYRDMRRIAFEEKVERLERLTALWNNRQAMTQSEMQTAIDEYERTTKLISSVDIDAIHVMRKLKVWVYDPQMFDRAKAKVTENISKGIAELEKTGSIAMAEKAMGVNIIKLNTYVFTRKGKPIEDAMWNICLTDVMDNAEEISPQLTYYKRLANSIRAVNSDDKCHEMPCTNSRLLKDIVGYVKAGGNGKLPWLDNYCSKRY